MTAFFQIYDTVEQINEWKTRRDFYLRFADNPQEFIQKWLISQSKDLKACASLYAYLTFSLQTMTEVAGDPEVERKAVYFHQPCIEEGVYRYIYSKVQQKRAELEQSLGVKNN
jgi:SWI/SNF-related matrix-associated actin-dependent regulator of chromatin subfamily D